MAPQADLLCGDRLATAGIGSSGPQQPIQHSHVEGSLGLLRSEAAGSQTRSDKGFVMPLRRRPPGFEPLFALSW